MNSFTSFQIAVHNTLRCTTGSFELVLAQFEGVHRPRYVLELRIFRVARNYNDTRLI